VAAKTIQVAVVMVRNHWVAVLLSAYCYKNYLSDSVKCIQSVLTEVISENITITIKVIQVDFSDV